MTVYLQDADVTLYHGDALETLRQLPASSVHMCATSPPFYGLRDYQADGQIGLEDTPDQWVQRLVDVFREVRRVLRDDGTLWVEIGDSYGSSGGNTHAGFNERYFGKPFANDKQSEEKFPAETRSHPTKPKDLLGQPWLLAFALRADGWYLRSEIIWARPNPMPESVTDRPTKSHSTVFLLSKKPRYYWDADAIREAHADHRNGDPGMTGANARSVWTIPTQPTPFAHFATWPEKLVARMIAAGTSERGVCAECGAPWQRETEVDPAYAAGVAYANARRRGGAKASGGGEMVNANAGSLGPGAPRTKTTLTLGWLPSCDCFGDGRDGTYVVGPPPVPGTVLDPFAGSGTTLLVARKHGRHSIGIELNPDYCQLAADRLAQQSLLTELA
jgi:DNA modification methylase